MIDLGIGTLAALIWPILFIARDVTLGVDKMKYCLITMRLSGSNSSKHPALISWMNLDLVTSEPL